LARSEVCTGVCTRRAIVPCVSRLSRITSRNRRNAEDVNGRYWARTSDPQLVETARTFAPRARRFGLPLNRAISRSDGSLRAHLNEHSLRALRARRERLGGAVPFDERIASLRVAIEERKRLGRVPRVSVTCAGCGQSEVIEDPNVDYLETIFPGWALDTELPYEDYCPECVAFDVRRPKRRVKRRSHPRRAS